VPGILPAIVLGFLLGGIPECMAERVGAFATLLSSAFFPGGKMPDSPTTQL